MHKLGEVDSRLARFAFRLKIRRPPKFDSLQMIRHSASHSLKFTTPGLHPTCALRLSPTQDDCHPHIHSPGLLRCLRVNGPRPSLNISIVQRDAHQRHQQGEDLTDRAPWGISVKDATFLPDPLEIFTDGSIFTDLVLPQVPPRLRRGLVACSDCACNLL
jgi:hypothetical protein